MSKDQLTRDALLDRTMKAANKVELIEDISSDKVKATGVLTYAGVSVDGDTVTIGTTVITLEAAAATANSIVSAALSLGDAATSLKEFINGETPSVAGVTFNLNTFNEAVKAVTTDTGELTVTAITAGAASNAIATTQVATNATWAAVTLTGGLDPALAVTSLSLAVDGSGDPVTYADDAAAKVGGIPIGGLYLVTATGAVLWRQV